jgi:hypothetical protein
MLSMTIRSDKSPIGDLADVADLLPKDWYVRSISREFGGGATVAVQRGRPDWARELGDPAERSPIIHVTIRGTDENIRAQLLLLSHLDYLSDLPLWTQVSVEAQSVEAQRYWP